MRMIVEVRRSICLLVEADIDSLGTVVDGFASLPVVNSQSIRY